MTYSYNRPKESKCRRALFKRVRLELKTRRKQLVVLVNAHNKGMLTLELSSYLLEIPNDAYTTLSQF